MTHKRTTLAAVDLGTNSFHLVVARVDTHSGRFRILTREKEAVRLGESSSDMKYLSPSAIKKGVDALIRFKAIADAYRAPIRAIGTSAVREAKNKNEFLSQVKRETGISLEIASGSEEARLIYLGVLQSLPVFDESVLSIDIGGGSTEFLIGYRRQSFYTNSLKLGAVRLSMKFFPEEPINTHAIKECRNHVVGVLNPIVRDVKHRTFTRIIGTSGTIQNIAKIISCETHGSVRGNLNGMTFTRDQLSLAVERILSARKAKQRAQIPGLDPARVDIIAAGAIILDEIFNELDLDNMTVSDYALREGIILDTIEKKYSRKRFHHLTNVRAGSVIHLSEHYGNDQEHADHVAFLAGRIFDQTKSVHKLKAIEREYLEVAAILHDVGFFISHGQHHLHTYYLIRNAELLGFTENEKEIIANIARYHRKSHPKLKHEFFRNLNLDERTVVSKLASILRIADGLDRTHTGAVKDVRCSVTKQAVTIRLQRKTHSSLKLNVWGAEWKRGLFEEVFQRKLLVRVH